MWIWIIVTIAIAILAGLYFWGNAISKKESEDAPKRLEEAQLAFEQGDMNICLSHLYHAFFIPFEEEYKKEQAQVALGVINLLEKVREKTDGDYQKMIDKIRPYLEHASKDGGKVSEKLTSPIKDFLSEQNDLNEDDDEDYPEVKLILENKEALNGGVLKGIVQITGGNEMHYLETLGLSANKEVEGSEHLDGLGYLSKHYFWEKIEPNKVKEIPFEFFLYRDDLELYKNATYELNVSLEGTDEWLIQDDVPFTIAKELAPNYRRERNDIYFCEENIDELFVGAHNSRDVSMHTIQNGFLIDWGSLLTARNQKGEVLWKRSGFEKNICVSPDGNKLLKNTASTYEVIQKLHVLSAETGKTLFSSEIEFDFYHMIWIKDYIILSHETSVYILDEELTLLDQIEKISNKEDDSIYGMSSSVDGNNVLICINGSSALIELNPKTKAKKVISNDLPVVGTIVYSPNKKRAVSRDWQDLTIYNVDNFDIEKITKAPGLTQISNFEKEKDSSSTWIIDEFVAFHPNSEKIVTNNGSGELLILDLETKTPEFISRDIVNLVESALWIDEDKIALVDSTGKFKLLSYSTKEVLFEEQDFQVESLLEIGINRVDTKDWLDRFSTMVDTLEKNPDIKITHLSVNSPIKNTEIERIEAELGFTLPLQLKNFYKQCNGVQLRWISTRDKYVNKEEFERSMVTTWLSTTEMDNVMSYGNASGIIHILPLQEMLFTTTETEEGKVQFGLQEYDQSKFMEQLKTFDKYSSHETMNIPFIRSNTANFVTFGESFFSYYPYPVFRFEDYLSFLILSYGLVKERGVVKHEEQSLEKLIEKYSMPDKIDLHHYNFED